MAGCCSSSAQLKPQGSCKALSLAVGLVQNSYGAKSRGRQCSSFLTETGAHVLPWPTTQETSISYPHWPIGSSSVPVKNHITPTNLCSRPKPLPSRTLCMGRILVPAYPCFRTVAYLPAWATKWLARSCLLLLLRKYPSQPLDFTVLALYPLLILSLSFQKCSCCLKGFRKKTIETLSFSFLFDNLAQCGNLLYQGFSL